MPAKGKAHDHAKDHKHDGHDHAGHDHDGHDHKHPAKPGLLSRLFGKR
ncbi:MAG: hypothetical protein WC876_03150 [Candidatus Thermoplasmatota archaeon]|jgi:hypothetical protein